MRAISELSHALGLLVVAEGIETTAALATARELGCDVVQGFHLARPMPPEELIETLAEPVPVG